MEAKTALELWKDGAEGHLNLQLYRCDVDSLLQEATDAATSSESSPRFYVANYELQESDDGEGRTISPEPGFFVLDPSSEEEGLGDVKLKGRVTPPLHLFDHLDSPTYEELLKQNWELFADSDQEIECSESFTLKDVPEQLELLGSPQVICSVVPEPTSSTRATQATVMYSPIKKAPKRKRRRNWGHKKRTQPPRKRSIMVSVDENGDGVESKVEDPLGRIVGCKNCQGFCQVENFVAGSASSVCPKALGQVVPWEPFLGPSTIPRIHPTPPIAESEFFAQHLARCAVDWDYPTALFSFGGYEPEPISQKGELASPTRTTFAKPGTPQPVTPLALEPKSTPALGAFNVISQEKKRHASSNLSSDSERERPRAPASFNEGLENVQPNVKSALRQNKRRRVVT